MMPALQRRGVISPGPLGPTSAQPRRERCAVTSAMSRTGMPSVTHTTRRMPASAASIIASRAKRAGTKSTATSAPVAATAAATASNTGAPSTVWPPFPGETPATTFVPAARMRAA
jgi:hypothetical protein